MFCIAFKVSILLYQYFSSWDSLFKMASHGASNTLHEFCRIKLHPFKSVRRTLHEAGTPLRKIQKRWKFTDALRAGGPVPEPLTKGWDVSFIISSKVSNCLNLFFFYRHNTTVKSQSVLLLKTSRSFLILARQTCGCRLRNAAWKILHARTTANTIARNLLLTKLTALTSPSVMALDWWVDSSVKTPLRYKKWFIFEKVF